MQFYLVMLMEQVITERCLKVRRGGGFKWTVFLGVFDAIRIVGFDFSFVIF